MQCLLLLVALLLALAVSTQAKESFATKATAKESQRRTETTDMLEEDSNNIDVDYIIKPIEPEEKPHRTGINGNGINQHHECVRCLRKLEEQLLAQSVRQRMVEKDHLIMERWLVDNIKDLHRELKQTETDLEHYVQVTKSILAQSESQIRQQLALALSQPSPRMAAGYRAYKQQEVLVAPAKWQVESLQALLMSEIAKQRGQR